jgi:hypothetical protein
VQSPEFKLHYFQKETDDCLPLINPESLEWKEKNGCSILRKAINTETMKPFSQKRSDVSIKN